jgi:hypothetical protein
MTESKKEWKKPELIVLVRSKPEEAVLYTCKSSAVFGGSNGGKDRCSYECVGCLGVETS